VVGVDCELGKDNHIHTCLLGDNSQLYANVRVKNSLLMDYVVIHKDSTVLNSLIGEGSVIGPGLSLEEVVVPAGITVTR
jgi:NDP-sugar pyrophosphorylase family protein